MEIEITKKDILWSYIAKFFQISSGLITLPFVLHLLSKEEVGLNYLMATVSSMVALIDFGFSPQFGRNFAFVNSGAQQLLKEGLSKSRSQEINYRLLKTTIKTAQYVYRRLSIVALILMLTVGSYYIYNVTKGFSIVDNSFIIWILFSISVYFNIYFSYYTGLLTGSGLIAENNQAAILSRFAYIVFALSFLYMGVGLFAIAIANLVAPFFSRFYAYYHYYTPELRSKLNAWNISHQEVKNTFVTIWYNAKKQGLNFISTYIVTKFGMFLAGLYLTLAEIGSFGLLMQLTSILTGISVSFYIAIEPQLISNNLNSQLDKLQKNFSMSMVVYYSIMIVGGLTIVFLAPWFLGIIRSNTQLPSGALSAVYILILGLEYNHCIFGGLIATKNTFPMIKAYLISSLGVLVLTFVFLQFTNLGLWGLVLAEGLVQIIFNNWYWPIIGCRKYSLNFIMIMKLGTSELFRNLKR